MPAAESYYWMITGQGAQQQEVDPNATPEFSLTDFVLSVQYPDHSIVNGSAFTYRLIRQVGVCR